MYNRYQLVRWEDKGMEKWSRAIKIGRNPICNRKVLLEIKILSK